MLTFSEAWYTHDKAHFGTLEDAMDRYFIGSFDKQASKFHAITRIGNGYTNKNKI